MSCYPICLTNLHRVLCVVIGGGNVAERKVSSLLEAGASIKVVSPRLTTGLQQLADRGQLDYISREYQSGDLDGAFLAIAATGDPATNRAVAGEAAARRTLINVVDDLQLCNFTVPATLSRGALTISVSTGGKSPALAAHVKKQIEDMWGPEYAGFAEILGDLRDPVTNLCPPEHRRELWYRLIESGVLDLVRQGDIETARDSAQHIVDSYISNLGEGDEEWKSSRLV